MFFILTPFRPLAWNLVKRLVRRQFPQVQTISTTQLAAWLTSEQSRPVLLDVRQAEEYAVSHLPGARHLPTIQDVQSANITFDTPLVLYCSVGYRSARLAQQLQAVGYSRVLNLEGSIFEWHNRGYPIVANDAPAQRVHPYNQIWGLLVKSSK
ncbi:MAG: rhodanese-like domain-containing protein [Cyanobacteria bacterium J06638_28]